MARGRTLSTAQEVLRVLRFLYEHPEGLTAKEVALKLGKSLYTAYYLLNSLCQEDFALRLEGGVYVPKTPLLSNQISELKNVAREANLLSKCRSYVVSLRGRAICLEATFGHQGQVGPAGLGRRLNRAAHALAVGKAVVAFLGPSVKELLPHPLPRFTPNTLSWNELYDELERIRSEGVAFDVEEYQQGVCCVAVPIRANNGAILALGLALPSGRFLAEGDKLADWLRRQIPKEVQHV
nr:IclR family transcriptional regulator C-terminal domain-containing protein [Thermus tengchongensis]